jgi:hypothetical protein
VLVRSPALTRETSHALTQETFLAREATQMMENSVLHAMIHSLLLNLTFVQVKAKSQEFHAQLQEMFHAPNVKKTTMMMMMILMTHVSNAKMTTMKMILMTHVLKLNRKIHAPVKSLMMMSAPVIFQRISFLLNALPFKTVPVRLQAINVPAMLLAITVP